MVGQAKLQSPEHDSIKLVDDKINWWDSVIEYLLDQTQMSVSMYWISRRQLRPWSCHCYWLVCPWEISKENIFPEMEGSGHSNQWCRFYFQITQEWLSSWTHILSMFGHLFNNNIKADYLHGTTRMESHSLSVCGQAFLSDFLWSISPQLGHGNLLIMKGWPLA